MDQTDTNIKQPYSTVPISDMWRRHGSIAPVPPGESVEAKLSRFLSSAAMAASHAMPKEDSVRISPSRGSAISTVISTVKNVNLVFDTPPGKAQYEEWLKNPSSKPPVLLSCKAPLSAPESYEDGHIIDVLIGEALLGAQVAYGKNTDGKAWVYAEGQGKAECPDVYPAFIACENRIAREGLKSLFPGFDAYIAAAQYFHEGEREAGQIEEARQGLAAPCLQTLANFKTRDEASAFYGRVLAVCASHTEMQGELCSLPGGAFLNYAMRAILSANTPGQRYTQIQRILGEQVEEWQEPAKEEQKEEQPEPEEAKDEAQPEEEQNEEQEEEGEDATESPEEGEKDEEAETPAPEPENATEGNQEAQEGQGEEEGSETEEGGESLEPASNEGAQSAEEDGEGEGEGLSPELEALLKDICVSGSIAAQEKGELTKSFGDAKNAEREDLPYGVTISEGTKEAAMRAIHALEEGGAGAGSPSPGSGVVIGVGANVTENANMKANRPGYKESWKRRQKAVKREAEKLRGRLRFAAEDKHLHEHGYKGGDIDEGNLCKLTVPGMTAEGDAPRVFSRVELIAKPGIGIGILIDDSSSMDNAGDYNHNLHKGTRSDQVRTVACLIMEALAGMAGVDVSVFGYTAGGDSRYSGFPRLGNSTGSLLLTEHVTPEYKGEHAAPSIEMLTGSGSTPTAPAIREAARRMLHHYPQDKYAKRLLFVLSDGAPGCEMETGPWKAEAIDKMIAQGKSAERLQNYLIHSVSSLLEVKYWADFARYRCKTEVIGIGIDSAYDQEKSDTMYGEGKGVVLADVSGASTVIANVITKTLKKM